MKPILPRDPSYSTLPERDLIGMALTATALVRTKVYHEIALRRHQSIQLSQVLHEAIAEEKNRKDIFFGFIKVAWIPVIDILEQGDEKEIAELKDLLKKTWTQAERNDLYEYVKKDFDIKDILN